MDWQRSYVGLAALLDAGSALEDVQPGVTYRGADIGRWVLRQARDWAQLNAEQRRRLEELGVRPRAAVKARKGAAQGAGKTGPRRVPKPSSEAFRHCGSTSHGKGRPRSEDSTSNSCRTERRCAWVCF
ncbi:hypothetical protein JCM13580A_62000 [Streptomyces drozdowiczii]